MDETMIRAILNLQNTKEKAVIATIIRTEGPTPRERGTKMLIGKGQTIGTIGGGTAENQIFTRALSLLTADSEVQGEIYRVVINQERDVSSLGVCGANMDVLLEPIQEDNLWQFAFKLLMEGKDIMLVTSLVPPYAKNILDSKGNVLWGQPPTEVMRFANKIQEIYSSQQTEIIRRSEEESGWLVEPVLKTTRLLILGAGYVAREVAYYAQPLDFQVTVLDDRAAFALPEFFSGAQAVICSDFAAGIRNYRINCDTYVVIATRSHLTDEECLKNVLNFKAKYVGMLGSSKKITAIAKRLRAKGYTDRDLARLRAPVGLRINAQTPAEIAISILAEIISVRREVNKTRTSAN